MESYPQKAGKPYRLGKYVCGLAAGVTLLGWPTHMYAPEKLSQAIVISSYEAPIPLHSAPSETLKKTTAKVVPKVIPKAVAPKAQNRIKPPVVKMASLEMPLTKSKPSVLRNLPPRIKTHDVEISSSLMGSMQIKFDDWQSVSAWSTSVKSVQVDIEQMRNCMSGQICHNDTIRRWTQKLGGLQAVSSYEKMDRVNLAANSLPYGQDYQLYGRRDYWASPQEMLNNSGDCEDYALLKYASLRALGFGANDMRFVIGKLEDGTPHAVLAVKLGLEEFILDNRKNYVYSAKLRTDYKPTYSVNANHRWTHFYPRKHTVKT